MKKIKFMDCSFRDGFQSRLGARVKTDDFLPALDAAVKAVETVDNCVGRVQDSVLKMGGVMLLTADHGNADKLLEEDGASPFTAHTTNPVPFAVIGKECKLRKGGKLCDISPTIIKLLGEEQPAEMDGVSIIE